MHADAVCACAHLLPVDSQVVPHTLPPLGPQPPQVLQGIAEGGERQARQLPQDARQRPRQLQPPACVGHQKVPQVAQGDGRQHTPQQRAPVVRQDQPAVVHDSQQQDSQDIASGGERKLQVQRIADGHRGRPMRRISITFVF